MSAPPQPGPNEFYGVFCDKIDQQSVQSIVRYCTSATLRCFQKVHLLFQSTGGSTDDGVCLYNFFRTFPLDLTLYNAGAVYSIATVAYLGAKHRKVSITETFMVHRTAVFFKNETHSVGQLEALAASARIDDSRTDAILKDHLKLSKAEWMALDRRDLTFTAKDAVAKGLAHEFWDFAPPIGTMLYSISKADS